MHVILQQFQFIRKLFNIFRQKLKEQIARDRAEKASQVNFLRCRFWNFYELRMKLMEFFAFTRRFSHLNLQAKSVHLQLLPQHKAALSRL